MLKIASFETVDTKLLAKAAQTGLPIIMSNGMMDFRELLEAVTVLRKNGLQDLTLLQCNSGYPATFEDANLSTMAVMKEMFDCKVGVSDHTLFVDTKDYKNPKPHITPLEAVKRGAKVVEVHVMRSREESKVLMEKGLGGFDWPFSRELHELKKMVDMIRDFENGGNPQYESEEEKQQAMAQENSSGQVTWRYTSSGIGYWDYGNGFGWAPPNPKRDKIIQGLLVSQSTKNKLMIGSKGRTIFIPR